MLVFWQEKLVILAIPKTGTTALEAALGPRASMVMRDPPQLKHTNCQRYRRFLGPLFEAAGGGPMDLVASVRHPVDWLGSWYRYRGRNAIKGQRNSTAGISFDDFVLEYIKEESAPYAAVGSQSRFLSATNGRSEADHVFRYEAQEKMLEFLAERLGPLPALEARNVSPYRPMTLSEEVEARLKDARAEDFAVWEAAQH